MIQNVKIMNGNSNNQQKATVSISHCSQITINNNYNHSNQRLFIHKENNTNNKDKHIPSIQEWFQTKIEKTGNKKDYEAIDSVLISCIEHIGIDHFFQKARKRNASSIWNRSSKKTSTNRWNSSILLHWYTI